VVTIAGDLKVHVFLVGRTVEQLIVSGLRSYLAAEVSTLPGFTGSGTGEGKGNGGGKGDG